MVIDHCQWSVGPISYISLCLKIFAIFLSIFTQNKILAKTDNARCLGVIEETNQLVRANQKIFFNQTWIDSLQLKENISNFSKILKKIWTTFPNATREFVEMEKGPAGSLPLAGSLPILMKSEISSETKAWIF